jgi:hypothetical protein
MKCDSPAGTGFAPQALRIHDIAAPASTNGIDEIAQFGAAWRVYQP